MRIECTTTFLHGRERFEKGDIFTVPDERGAYFVSYGWAKEVGAPDLAVTSADPTTLDVQSVSHKQKVVTRG